VATIITTQIKNKFYYNEHLGDLILLSPKTRTQTNKMQNMYILNNKYTLQTSHWPELVANYVQKPAKKLPSSS
jgi:hypothetical protein